MAKTGVSVGILRHPLLSRMKQEEEKHMPSLSVARERWAACVEQRIVDIRELLEELTDQLSLLLHVTEYQVFENPNGGAAVLLGKRARNAVEHDMLVTVDPTPTEYNFVTRPRRDNPLQRSLIGYTDKAMIMDTLPLLTGARVLLVATQGISEAVSRVFPIHTPLEDSTAIDALKSQRHIVERAIRYPYIPTTEVLLNPLQIVEIDSEDLLSTLEGREYLQDV